MVISHSYMGGVRMMKNIRKEDFLMDCYPTVEEVLRFSVFERSRLLTPTISLDLPVCGVNLTDTPDYMNWIEKSEMLITTCFSIYKDEDALKEFIPALAQKKLSAVCIKTKRYLEEIPDYMVQQAKMLKLPLVELKPEIRFADITKAVADELQRRQTRLLRSSLYINQMLIQTITAGATLDEITQMIGEIMGCSTMIVDHLNRRQAVFLKASDQERFDAWPGIKVYQALMDESNIYEMNHGEQYFGNIYLHQNPELKKMNEALMQQILQIVPLEISRMHALLENEDRLFTEYFLHLTSGEIENLEEEEIRAASFGIDLSEAHIFINLKLQMADVDPLSSAWGIKRTVYFHGLKEELRKRQLSLRIIQHGEKDILFLSAKNETILQESGKMLPVILESLYGCSATLEIHAGISRVHTGINTFGQCYHEAELAFQASFSQMNKSILYFEQLSILRLLYANNTEKAIAEFIAETLKEIVDAGFPQGEELLHTLEVYFAVNGNQRRMAETLYIHYNTVPIRLNKIQDVTGLSLHREEDRILLELAIYLRKFFS